MTAGFGVAYVTMADI